VLDATGLSKSFDGLRAVHDVSIAVPDGAIIALIGPNGAGKTTTFAMLAGFIRPDAGVVRFNGTDITGWRPDRIAALGMVRTFQITQPFAGLSVLENIRVGAFLREPDPTAAEALASEIGTSLGLGPWLQRQAATLTVAGRKRLEIARALATKPSLLLLDEVMAGLTPTEIDDIVARIRSIRDSGVAVLLIEHVMRAVTALADRVVVLAEGALIASGTAREIAADRRVVEAYLGHGAADRMTGDV